MLIGAVFKTLASPHCGDSTVCLFVSSGEEEANTLFYFKEKRNNLIIDSPLIAPGVLSLGQGQGVTAGVDELQYWCTDPVSTGSSG